MNQKEARDLQLKSILKAWEKRVVDEVEEHGESEWLRNILTRGFKGTNNLTHTEVLAEYNDVTPEKT